MNHVASQSKHMTAECKETMMEVQYFMARDFSLDPRLYSGIMPIRNWQFHYNKAKLAQVRYIFPAHISALASKMGQIKKVKTC